MSSITNHALVSSIATGFALASQPALAQAQSGPASGESVEAGITEIVVTAQRRSQSLSDVPISVQALTNEQLARQAVIDTRDLSSIAPTVNFATGSNASAVSFALRGVSSVAIQQGIQPSTAMVVDGVPVVKQAEFISGLGDIDRIEILNGPQGTLFGKNSTAGVISVVTRDPERDFGGELEALVTTDEEVYLRGMINAPVGDRVRVRINGYYRDQLPLVKNKGTAPDVMGQKSYGVSAKLAFDISDDATFTLAGIYAHTNSSAGQLVAVKDGVLAGLITAIGGAPSWGHDEKYVATDTETEDFFTTKKISGTLDWRLSDELSLVSITSYTSFKEESNLDVDGTPAGANLGRGQSAPGTSYPFFSVFKGYPRFPDDVDYFSQEVRANYTSGPIDAVFGAYYQHVSENYFLSFPLVFDGSIIGLTPGTLFYSSPEPQADMRDTTASIFGDVTYRVTDQIKLFGGLRYTHERLKVDYHRDEYFGLYSDYDPVTGVFNQPPVFTYDTKSTRNLNDLSGRAGIQFEPNRDMNFYASFAKGYKGSAFDVGSTLLVGKDPILKPEKATAYEVGAKLRFMENRLAINGALFYEKIKDIQASVTDPNATSQGIEPQLLNAGQLKTRGFEGDMAFAVTPNFRLNGSLAYVKATYANFAVPCNSIQNATNTCPNFGGVAGLQDITGQPANGAPKWKYSIGADYEGRFSGSDMGYYAQMSWTWNSEIQYQLGNDPITRERGHGMLNAAVGIKGPDDNWEIQVFGKNLTDRLYYGYLQNFALDGLPIGYLPRDFHRYLGLKLKARF